MAMKRVGLVGWRGMVGSVLMQRMQEERDFDLIEPVFFTTSNPGGKSPNYGKEAPPLKDAKSVDELKAMDIIISCQGGDYTNEVYPELRKAARKQASGMSRVPIPTRSALDVSPEERRQIYERLWEKGGSQRMMSAFTDLMRNEQANESLAAFVREKIRAIVKDPVTREILTPRDHPIGSRRLCVDTDYYETYNRDNVKLVDARRTPIVEITEKGLRTTEAEYDVDIIAFATGFDAMTGALSQIEIAGRDGCLLKDAWAAGPVTYLGLMVHGFPNLFIVTGPGSPSVKANMVTAIEQHVEWISDCLAYMQRGGMATIEPTMEAQDQWVRHVNEVANGTLFVRATNSWYMGANIPGKPRVFMPYVAGLPAYIQICEEVVADGYRGFMLQKAPSPAERALAD